MRVSEKTMKKQKDKTEVTEQDSLKAHYDFDYTKAKPNCFAARLNPERLMVVLDPDVAAIFPTLESVNETLRVLATSLQNLPTKPPSKRRKSSTDAAPATSIEAVNIP